MRASFIFLDQVFSIVRNIFLASCWVIVDAPAPFLKVIMFFVSTLKNLMTFMPQCE